MAKAIPGSSWRKASLPNCAEHVLYPADRDQALGRILGLPHTVSFLSSDGRLFGKRSVAEPNLADELVLPFAPSGVAASQH
jgi:hypothetical protein